MRLKQSLFVMALGLIAACSSGGAREYGYGWIIIQNDTKSRPVLCWEAQDLQGLYVSGLTGVRFTVIEVANSKWDEAYESVGLTRTECMRIQRHFEPQSSTLP